MASQIEKWEEREKKRKKFAEERKKHQEEQRAKAQETAEPKQEKQNNKTPSPTPKNNKTDKGEGKMADKNWNDELKGDDTYKLAEKLGIDLSSFTADSEDSKKSQLDEIKKKIREMENFPEGTTPTPEEQKLFDDIKKEGQQPSNDNDNKRETLEVNGEQQDQPTPENQDWIQKKREFYSKFAQENGVIFKNDEEKDTAEKTFTFSFEKDNKNLGEIKYKSANNVTISNDAELIMYQGIVKDALENNLNLSFGNSLSDKQKAMLLAATLMNEQKTYKDGSGLVLKNAPSIDINAEYFKALPQNVQSVLKEHVNKQSQQNATQNEATPNTQREAADKKIKELRDKIRAKAKTDGKETKDLTTDEYRAAMLEGMSDEQKKAHLDKMEEREKRTAARLGITGEYKTKDKDGKDVVIKEDAKVKALYTDENSPLKNRYNELLNKYNKGRN